MSNNEPAHITAQKQKTVGAFNRAAPLYDQIGPHFFSYFGQRLVDMAQLAPGSIVLDVACGRGAVLFPAARIVGEGGSIIGIDLAEVMVRETAQEIERMNLSNARVLLMDAERLQFEDRSFDYVLSGLALLFFPQPERAIAEMKRVLKPGGCLAISTWDRIGDEIWHWLEDDLYHAYIPPTVELEVEPLTGPVSLGTSTASLDTAEGIYQAFEAAGFEHIQVLAESVDMTYESAQEWWDALWATSMRLMLEEIEQAVGQDGLERFRLDVFNHLKTIQQPDGIHQLWPLLFCLARKPGG